MEQPTHEQYEAATRPLSALVALAMEGAAVFAETITDAYAAGDA